MHNQKVLILGNENCGLIHNLSAGLKVIGGFDITTAVWQKDNFFQKHKYDLFLERPVRVGNSPISFVKYWIRKAIWGTKNYKFSKNYFTAFDIYIFTWQTYKGDYSDLQELKKNGKKIVFLFIGSDIRWIEAFRQQYPGNPYLGDGTEDWIKKIRLLRLAELNCSAIFSMPDMSSLIIRGYYHMFMPVDLNKITFTPQFRDKPYIIHAPSKRDIKGTGIILKVIEELNKEGIAFNFEVLENVSNETVLQKLEDADIVVDQLYLNGPGTLATEGMAAGCAIATRYLRDNPLTGNAPFCYVDEVCLKEGLRKLILDLPYRKDLIIAGKEFVKENNAPEKIAQRIINSISRSSRGDYDYKPDFFTNNFVLPERLQYPDEIKVLNKAVMDSIR